MTAVFFIGGKVILCIESSVFFTPGMKIWRLWTMDLLFMCITPLLRLLWLHHRVRSLVGSILS